MKKMLMICLLAAAVQQASAEGIKTAGDGKTYTLDLLSQMENTGVDKSVDEDDVLLWDNAYDRGTRINEYRLTMFKKDEATGLFARQDELHRQRADELAEITRILAEAGMTFVRAEDAYTGKPVTETTERILIIAKESYQANKYYE